MTTNLNVGNGLRPRFVVEGVLSNLAFQRSRFTKAWGVLQPILLKKGISRIAHEYPPELVRLNQRAVVQLLDVLLSGRGEREREILAENINVLEDDPELGDFVTHWRTLVASEWERFGALAYQSPFLRELEDKKGRALEGVLDKWVMNSRMSRLGIETEPPLRSALLFSLTEFVRGAYGPKTPMVVLSPDREQADLMLVKLLRHYPLLSLGRWDDLAHAVRQITVFATPPNREDLDYHFPKKSAVLIMSDAGMVSDGMWSGLIRYLTPRLIRNTVLAFGCGDAFNGFDSVFSVAEYFSLDKSNKSSDAESPAVVPEPEAVSETEVVSAPANTKTEDVRSGGDPEPPAPAEPLAKEIPVKTASTMRSMLGHRFTNYIDDRLAQRAFHAAATSMKREIEDVMARARDRGAAKANLRYRLERQAWRNYNASLPRGTLPVRSVIPVMLQGSGDPVIIGLLKKLGLL